MSHFSHLLKRLQHTVNSFNGRSTLPDDEHMRECVQMFARTSNTPGPRHARRGGGGGGGRRTYGGTWSPSVSLPKRIIHYDLAESFMDHSTNPLSSDLYKIRFKHSAKQWPAGRFSNYKEKLDKNDGNIIDIISTQTFPTVPKRKKALVTPQNTMFSSINVLNPLTQEQRKNLADKQTNVYANLFGCVKTARFSSSVQIKKINSVNYSTTTSSSSASMVVVNENQEDEKC